MDAIETAEVEMEAEPVTNFRAALRGSKRAIFMKPRIGLCRVSIHFDN